MTWLVSHRDETWQLTEEAIREGLTSKSIPGDALVWTEGMTEWRPATGVFAVTPDTQPSTSRESSTRNSPSLFLLLLAVGSLFVAAVFIKIWQDLIVDFLETYAGLAAAIMLHFLLLVMVAVLCSIATLRVWRHPSRRGASGVAGALFFLSACTLLVQTINLISFALVANDIYRMKVAVGTWNDADIRKTANGTATLIGPLGPHLMRDFTALEDISGPIKVIEITSEGGLVDQALEFARQVESRRISIIVRHQCLSACILIAVASPESYADEDAVFGFHRTSPVVEVGTEIAEYANDQVGRDSLDFLRQHGVPESVLDEAAKHGPDSVHVVSAQEMVEYGAIKGVVSGGRVIKVGQKR